jgi:hypothetical protein
MAGILLTNRESRSEALRFYTKAFSFVTTTPYVFVNFSVDTIKANSYDVHFMKKEERALIKELVLTTDSSEHFHTTSPPCDFQMMRELKKLVILSTLDHE